MPRRSTEEKAESRIKILEAAAQLIRIHGIEGTSVSQIMDRAGLTHGGFYRHFESKEELVAEAIAEAFKAGLNLFDNDKPGSRTQALAYLDQYLDATHVSEPEIGCPMPTLSAEIARGGDDWKSALSKGLDRASTRLAEGVFDGDQTQAICLLSQLVGAITLARAVNDPTLRDRLLAAAVDRVQLTIDE
ncbi:MAG: TetR/AcrR family transcriptional regulator [Pseudomonadota bacterium]